MFKDTLKYFLDVSSERSFSGVYLPHGNCVTAFDEDPSWLSTLAV
jgi:hypothetical protein